MLEVGGPDPALVHRRTDSTGSWAPNSAATSSDTSLVSPVVMTDSSPEVVGLCGYPPARRRPPLASSSPSQVHHAARRPAPGVTAAARRRQMPKISSDLEILGVICADRDRHCLNVTDYFSLVRHTLLYSQRKASPNENHMQNFRFETFPKV